MRYQHNLRKRTDQKQQLLASDVRQIKDDPKQVGYRAPRRQMQIASLASVDEDMFV